MIVQQSGRVHTRVLLLEDNRADAKLYLSELAQAGFEISGEIVSTSEEFLERLQAHQYDLILAEYQLPN